jgi:hypothetical protein
MSQSFSLSLSLSLSHFAILRTKIASSNELTTLLSLSLFLNVAILES